MTLWTWARHSEVWCPGLKTRTCPGFPWSTEAPRFRNNLGEGKGPTQISWWFRAVVGLAYAPEVEINTPRFVAAPGWASPRDSLGALWRKGLWQTLEEWEPVGLWDRNRSALSRVIATGWKGSLLNFPLRCLEALMPWWLQWGMFYLPLILWILAAGEAAVFQMLGGEPSEWPWGFPQQRCVQGGFREHRGEAGTLFRAPWLADVASVPFETQPGTSISNWRRVQGGLLRKWGQN